MADAQEQRVLDAARTLVEHWDNQDGFGADIIEALRDAVRALDGVTAPRSEPSWLVKDFNILYRTAKRLIEREPDARGNTPDSDLEDLEATLEHLKPAFEMTESVRTAARLGVEIRPATDAEASDGLDRYYAEHRERLEGFATRGRNGQQAVDEILAAHEATKKAGEGD